MAIISTTEKTTRSKGDAAMSSVSSTVTIPTRCPCPIPKAALETAAIIASSTEILMGQQQQQRSSSHPPFIPLATTSYPSKSIHHDGPGASQPYPSINSVQRISLSTTTAPLPTSLPQPHPGKKQQCMPLHKRPSLYQTLPSSTSSLSSHLKEQQSTTTQKEPLPPTTTTVTVTAKTLSTITAVATPIKMSITKKKRSGKWTPEEEIYANILIELFETGEVDKFEHHLRNNNNREKEEYQQQQKQKHQPHNTEISNGMTLRSYLSRKLFCSPMRISKKFAGKGIGKRVYMSRNPSKICYHQHLPFTPGSGGTTMVSNTNNSTTSNTSVTPTLPFSHPCDSSLLPLSSYSTVEHRNKLNRLKEAESNFCEVAFPNDDLIEAYTSTKIHPALLKAASTPYVAPITVATTSIQKQKNIDTIPTINKSKHVNVTVNTTIQSKATNSAVPQLHQYQFHVQSSSVLDQKHQQQQQQQLYNNNPGIVYSQNQPFNNGSGICSNHEITVVGRSDDDGGNYDASSYKTWQQNQQQELCPMTVAPPLLSNTQLLLPKLTTAEVPRQYLQKESLSKIQRLKEAYFSSVSRDKSNASKNVSTTNSKATAQHSLNTNRSNLPVYSQMQQQESSIETKRPTRIGYTVPQTGAKLTEIATIHSFDMNQMTNSSNLKLQTDIPNLLSGFDNMVPKNEEHPDQNISLNNDETATNLHLPAQYSPAYHTSKSFDDFHRYLGNGLPPTFASPSKFLLLSQSNPHDHIKNCRPVIPSIDSPEKAFMSNLQMRPRGQHTTNTDIDGIRNKTTKTNFCLPVVEGRSDKMLLSEAYAEAVARSSVNQPLTVPSPNNTQRNDEAIKADSYSIFSEESARAIKQHSTFAKEKEQEMQHQDHTKHDGTEFPLEGMTFEDFGTLESSSDSTMFKSYANVHERAAAISEPSDCPSEDPNSGSGGGTSDESDEMQSEGSSRCKKKARLSEQSWAWEMNL